MSLKWRLGIYDHGLQGDYAEWIAQNDTLTDSDRDAIRRHIMVFSQQPLISILMPVYNTPLPYLREAIESVLNQLYPNWELCIVDDASDAEHVRSVLEEYSKKDSRIKTSFRPKNGGISASTNSALELACGEWILLMDHDDVLSEHALYFVAEAINRDPGVAIIYSDEDKIDTKGRRYDPYFKPDWDYDLFLGQNMISHLGAYRADLARKVGGFREGFEGSQDWDFALRVLEAAPGAMVRHIPYVLYHWRQTKAQFSRSSEKCAAHTARRAVNDHFTRTGQTATATLEGHSSHLRIRRELPANHPLVSIIIPTKDHADLLSTCIDGLLNRTDYAPMEIIIVDNGSTESEAVALLAELYSRDNIHIIEDERLFNFSRLVNQGVAAAQGEVVVLINNDIDVINQDWLREMVSHAVRPEVGAVGAKLYYADDTLQHGGVILDLGGIANHVHEHAPRHSPGYSNRLNLTQSLSCVKAACLATRREIYQVLGGFNEADLPVSFNDVDYCVRVRQTGYRVIWTPWAELYHHANVSCSYETTPEKKERSEREAAYMRRMWTGVLDNDPFYNPNLALTDGAFVLADAPRVIKPWHKASTRPSGCA